MNGKNMKQISIYIYLYIFFIELKFLKGDLEFIIFVPGNLKIQFNIFIIMTRIFLITKYTAVYTGYVKKPKK